MAAMAIFDGPVFERKHIGKISIPGLLMQCTGLDWGQEDAEREGDHRFSSAKKEWRRSHAIGPGAPGGAFPDQSARRRAAPSNQQGRPAGSRLVGSGEEMVCRGEVEGFAQKDPPLMISGTDAGRERASAPRPPVW